MSTIDSSRLDMITEGDEATKKELLDLFFATVGRCTMVMDNKADENDEAWREAAHELKGAAGTLGFTHVAEICRSVEDIHPIKIVQKQQILSELALSLDEVRNFASKFTDS